MKPIWIVDDDQSIRWVLEKALARENFATRSFSNVREAASALDHDSPQVLVSDIRMPGGSGLELLQTVRERLPGLPVIIMTAFSDLDSAVAAFQGGAFEYLAKPFDVDKAVELIRRAVDESMRGEQHWDDRPAEAPEMLGQAPAMQDMFRAIGRLSHSAATVLITGESGTGKELVARALHRHSPRANGPFIALNTAAIPKDLLESELFGHERGAFTGAQAMRQGRFEQAENGTLFLDEIGDMPFDLQTRLLRVLSDGQFYRVGGHNPLRANVRVIAATHQNLETRVRQGLFREDLYHRLNVIRLRLPALRERSEDIPLLTRHFLQKSARELGVEPKRVSDEALAYMSSLPFPGNVRQLENLANWLTVMAPAQTIEIKDLPPDLMPAHGAPGLAAAPGDAVVAAEAAGAVAVGAAGVSPVASTVAGAGGVPGAIGGAVFGAPGFGAANGAVVSPLSVWESGLRTEVARLLRENSADVMDELSRRFEAAVIREALDFTRGRKVEAAERLGIGRNTITRKIQELNLE
ncbi:nitrogen regulation protein NR(I) [Paraburkholderia lycopersici]|uniref:DNA-binding transcriptional regulator NtrC n=1 Tax=Paraburkholderia lycopersici TaxID=416944 RepID=A0A1G6I477_9BURK|nr:nitrogen regulation protein NR(I) [Paraburkholderia lycopersici]SDC01230.1 two-component system, NtrC family, nitrogen regulation response regulator GlnG [Paraburkholderia lycopersici]